MLGKGALIGIGAAAPPGPVNLEIARRTIARGWLAGAAIGLGAVTIDVCFAVLLVVGWLELINSNDAVRLTLSIVGMALLFYLGGMALRSAFRRLGNLRDRRASESKPTGDPTTADPTTGGPLTGDSSAGLLEVAAANADEPGVSARITPAAGYATGLLLCSTSPYQAAFWLTAVPSVFNASDAAEGLGPKLLVCAGVFGATLLWVTVFTTLLWQIRRLGRSAVLPLVMDSIGGIVLTGFGLMLAASLLKIV